MSPLAHVAPVAPARATKVFIRPDPAVDHTQPSSTVAKGCCRTFKWTVKHTRLVADSESLSVRRNGEFCRASSCLSSARLHNVPHAHLAVVHAAQHNAGPGCGTARLCAPQLELTVHSRSLADGQPNCTKALHPTFAPAPCQARRRGSFTVHSALQTAQRRVSEAWSCTVHASLGRTISCRNPTISIGCRHSPGCFPSCRDAGRATD